MRLDDAYRLLDTTAAASDEEVKRAYRDLLKVWHPDRFGNDETLRRKAEEKLKMINAAFETIEKARHGRTRSSSNRNGGEEQESSGWLVRQAGNERGFQSLEDIAGEVERGAINGAAEVRRPRSAGWLPLSTFPELRHALRRRKAKSYRAWAITLALLGLMILLRRPTPAGLVVGGALFSVSFLLVRWIRRGEVGS